MIPVDQVCTCRMGPAMPTEIVVIEDMIFSVEIAGCARIANRSCLGDQMILRPQGIVAELFSERFCEREHVSRRRRQAVCYREGERATRRARKEVPTTEEIIILHSSISAMC